jgi:glutamyl-tRNA synthetase
MTQDAKPKVRFAPSPTGFLHIGGARTALFNWLFARHTGGVFQLRIEDTDRARSEDRFRDEILESMKWLGLTWDEGPIYQSDRFELYRDYAHRLVDKGLAEKSDGAVVFKIPPEHVKIQDLVYGELQFDNSLLEQLVILKSDGTPTYNFACVIDDATLGVTHVIRGDDHVSNTPKQVAVYQALELPMPQFAHVPMILGSDGQRLSKRHGATAVLQYRESGFLPEALTNFLALLGWAPGGDREMMTQNELIELFSLDRVNRKSAIFDMTKLEWMNGQYILKKSVDQLAEDLRPFVKSSFSIDPPFAQLKGLTQLFQQRIKRLSDFPNETHYFFQKDIQRDADAVQKYLSSPESKSRLMTLKKSLEPVQDFNPPALEKVIRDLATQLGVKAGELIHPARVAITGKAVSPGFFDVMSLLGRDLVLKRLEEVAAS